MNGEGGGNLIRIGIGLVIALVAAGIFAVTSCQQGPFGRKQLVRLKPEQEMALGAQAYQEVLKESEGKVLSGGAAVRAVQQITNRLVEATKDRKFLEMTKIPERPYQWEVKVLRSREVNAFCLPGGKMVVYTGIMKVARNDAQLATVMGHEIAHALGRHGAERMAQQQLAQIGVTAAGLGLGSMDPRDRDRVMMVLNAGAKFGILKYSRSHESEADHMGLLLMATAGYRPAEAVKFWEEMQADAKKRGGKSPPEFLSTHPSHETRIRDLVKWQTQADPLYEASKHRSRPRPLPAVE